MKYRRKPLPVEAMQYTGTNADEIVAWASPGYDLETEEGWQSAPVVPNGRVGLNLANDHDEFWITEHGTWIFRSSDGTFDALPDEVFRELFEPDSE